MSNFRYIWVRHHAAVEASYARGFHMSWDLDLLDNERPVRWHLFRDGNRLRIFEDLNHLEAYLQQFPVLASVEA